MLTRRNQDIIRYPENSIVDPVTFTIDAQTTYKHETEFRVFVDELVGRSWKSPLNSISYLRFPSADVVFCLLNSCSITATKWTEYGYVAKSGISSLQQLRDCAIARPTYKLMALHHHLLPVSKTAAPNAKDVSICLDAAALLDAAQLAGVHLTLHGHEHVCRLTRYQTILRGETTSRPGLHILSTGSAGAKNDRLHGGERNACCIVGIEQDHLQLMIRELRSNGEEAAAVCCGRLEITPLQAASQCADQTP